MNPNVLIATPTHRGEVSVEYVQSVLALISALPHAKMSGGLVFRNGTGIDAQRNWLASFFWAHEHFTHLLFIDDDMAFKPSAAFKLIRSGYDVCGCICPRKEIDLESYHMARLKGLQAVSARNASQRYVGPPTLGHQYPVLGPDDDRKPDFVRVDWIGCGITLISRKAIDAMLRSDLHINRASYFGGLEDIPNVKETIRFFDHIDDVDGTRLSEDISFCRRWRDYCDGQIWACVTEEIGHVGRHTYRGMASEFVEYGPILAIKD